MHSIFESQLNKGGAERIELFVLSFYKASSFVVITCITLKTISNLDGVLLCIVNFSFDIVEFFLSFQFIRFLIRCLIYVFFFTSSNEHFVWLRHEFNLAPFIYKNHLKGKSAVRHLLLFSTKRLSIKTFISSIAHFMNEHPRLQFSVTMDDKHRFIFSVDAEFSIFVL